jgi:anaerobic selenocysteine-containing dehydrogenase
VEVRSFCRICAAACGVLVDVEGDRVTRVRGDAEHPISRGYTCAKGRALPALHHSPSRLNAPMLNGAVVAWDRVLDDLAVTIAACRDRTNSDAIGMYLATGMAYDSAGQVASGQFMRGIGSSSFYTAATVDNAPVLLAAEQITGDAMLNPVWEPAGHGLLLIVGSNPVVSHGYGTTLADPVRRLREFRAGGGRVIVIDPRRTETAAHADAHLAPRPGADVALLAAVAREILAEGANEHELYVHCWPQEVASLRAALEPFTIQRAAQAAGLAEHEVVDLISSVRTARGRLAVFCGTGTTMARDGILVEWLRWVLLIISGSLDVQGGMRFNRAVVNRLRPPKRIPDLQDGPRSRSELPRVAGQLPAVALVDEIESGALRLLIVSGGNPIAALPEPERVRDALQSLDALVVVDVADNELVRMATHVVPAAGQLERADLTLAEHVAFRSGMQFASAVVPLGAERRPVWWFFASLARRLGFDLFDGDDPDELDDATVLRRLLAHGPLDAEEVLAAGAIGVDLEVTYGWVREGFLLDGRWRIAPQMFVDRLARHREPDAGLVMVPRRENGWSNSVTIAGAGDEPVLMLHPDDATAAGLAEGGWVALSSAHGTLVATATIDATLRRGVVSVTHGHPGASPGMLTSSRVAVDPLTTMPVASGLSVSITALSM